MDNFFWLVVGLLIGGLVGFLVGMILVILKPSVKDDYTLSAPDDDDRR